MLAPAFAVAPCIQASRAAIHVVPLALAAAPRRGNLWMHACCSPAWDRLAAGTLPTRRHMLPLASRHGCDSMPRSSSQWNGFPSTAGFSLAPAGVLTRQWLLHRRHQAGPPMP